ncbi:hypothetical protein GGP41_000458 [Bipolaris sorokiniana]|uniref:Enoyl reductase (ER) domain-containing protein n=2 Tax=Cochliobolus sativus TaxID=45130 RepID=A0A8H5ZP61_COCSA|nr:hypothetical protein GGP41_000458 [Bipolaris sorokiniana]
MYTLNFLLDHSRDNQHTTQTLSSRGNDKSPAFEDTSAFSQGAASVWTAANCCCTTSDAEIDALRLVRPRRRRYCGGALAGSVPFVHPAIAISLLSRRSKQRDSLFLRQPVAHSCHNLLPQYSQSPKMSTDAIPTTQTAGWIQDPGPDCVLQIRNDVAVKQASAGEVLVKLEYSGICHSDCHNLAWPGKYTEVPGHEGVGTVVSLGANVSSELMGKRVGIKWLWNACQTCSSCKQGKENHCAKQKNTGRNVWGTLQQYVVADAQFVTMIPDGVKSEIAAPLLCAGLSLAGGVSKLEPEVKPGDFVAIVGAGGGLGHIGVQIASIKGYKVIAIDSGAEKEKLAKEMGAVAFVDFAKQDVVQAVRELTDGEGAHGVICVAGSEKAYIQAPDLCRNSGVFVCVGLPPDTFMFPMSPIHIANKGLTIRGSSTGSAKQMDELLQMAVEGKITPKVEVYDFADSPKILQELKRYEVTGRKVVRAP